MTSSFDPTRPIPVLNFSTAPITTAVDEGSSQTQTEERAKILYSKSKTYLHPTPSWKDNIPGYIAILEREALINLPFTSDHTRNKSSKNPDSFLLAWIPENSLSGDALCKYSEVELEINDSPSTKSLSVPLPPVMPHPDLIGYNGFAIPLSSIYSVHSRPPSLGWWFGSLIINSRTGNSFPPLFLHDSECKSTILQQKKHLRESFDPFGLSGVMFWGGDQVLVWLGHLVEVQSCAKERNIYLIEPSIEDLNALGTVSVTASYPRPSRNRFAASEFRSDERFREVGNRNLRNTQLDPFTKFVRETGWNLMEKLSQVTTFARRTADSVVENPSLPPQVRKLLRNPEVQTLQDEFDSARIYLAKWAMGIAEQSERDRNQRSPIARNISEVFQTDVGDFEVLNDEIGALSVQDKRKTVTLAEWNSFFDLKNHKLIYTVDEVKERIFHGGLDAEDGVRGEAWLFLLGVYKWDSTAKERQSEISSLRDEYLKLKGAWWNRLANQNSETSEGEWWREQKSRIEKDVHRTDRTVLLFAGEDTPHPDPLSPFAEVGTNVHLEQMKDMLLTYNEYNRDLGYVQGMSDLLAPIYAVLQDDAIAFWAFKNFMHRMESNFLRDQSGMRRQLLALDNLVQLMDPKLHSHLQSADCTNFFFFFRMLLVWFKREFSWENVLRLWEGLWTDYLTSSFHLFIALAILEQHRDVIMEHLKLFDEVLKYVNELSANIDLEATLIRAEALFRRFQRIVESIDKKSNFPAPNFRQPVAKTQFQRNKVPSSSINSGSEATTSTSRTGSKIMRTGLNSSVDKSKDIETEDPRDNRPEVISPELRQLLSRKLDPLPGGFVS